MRRFSLSSRALGERETVYVFIYPTLGQMRLAAERLNGVALGEALGVTQAYTDDSRRAGTVLIRLAEGHLSTRIITHELHHAATAIYGAHVGDRISRRAHLNHYNEPFAHLYSDLAHRMLDEVLTR